MPGATIIIKNNGTNQESRTKSSSSGTFSVNNLDPVMYSVTAEAAGFKRETVENVKVDTAAIETVNLNSRLARCQPQLKFRRAPP